MTMYMYVFRLVSFIVIFASLSFNFVFFLNLAHFVFFFKKKNKRKKSDFGLLKFFYLGLKSLDFIIINIPLYFASFVFFISNVD